MRRDGSTSSPGAADATVRPYRPRDAPAVRDLIDADRLPGQPHFTQEPLANPPPGPTALASWAAPAPLRLIVLADAADQPHGALAYLSFTDAPTGLICWLHARENPAALRALLGHALAALAACPLIDAFAGPAPSTLGPHGLPRTRRPATHEALLEAGFTGHRQGCYLHRLLPAAPLADKATADVFPCDFPPGHRLILREAARPVAEALVSVAPDHRATVCWIETQPPHRRRGLGRNLLSQALALLAEQGATEVALTLEDTPHTDVARAAHQLFASFGFTTVDQLWTYQRRPGTTQPTR